MEKYIKKYSKLYKSALIERNFSDIEGKTTSYKKRLNEMYASDVFMKHNVYPTMNVEMVYSVITMCLELKEYGLSDNEIITFVNEAFKKRKKFFGALEKIINSLPNSYQIARKWNISDHEKRVRDGSITYDFFEVSEGKVEYTISKCMYIEMFEYYGIRSLCKIFCMTDEYAYANLTKHVKFIRHSDLSDGEACHDEIIDKRFLEQ